MDIGDVAKRAGVSASTLRYYEEKRLIASNGRRGLRRTFDAGVIQRLALIALGQAAGFSLEEIRSMLGSGTVGQINREALASKADELDGTIRTLTAMRDGLRHAALCSAPSHLECPKFRRLMRLAATGAIKGAEPRPFRRRRAKGL